MVPSSKATGAQNVPPGAHAANDVPIDVQKEEGYDVTSRTSTESVHRTYSPILSPNVGVNVERAEAEFAELSKELTRSSAHHGKISPTQSRRSQSKLRDEEKIVGISSSESEDIEEPFDLEATLRGNKGEEDASGIKSKRIGVIWDGLTVSGLGGVRNYVKTFPWAFVSFFNIYETGKSILGLGKKGKEFDILRNFKGMLRPGEMCLVLGRPGSGCTTFLKVISNQRYGYTNINGEVLYGQFDALTFEKRYRGEAVYNGEDDIHHPTLTVGQTLDFALDTKVPGKRPAGLSRADFKERVISLMLNMFNISHTRDTIVGNPFVRGISGGERKRVSIAEMMVTGATVCSWDNTTRGLDASTAVDWARSLRILTDIYGMTSFVSLYQASENIYQQFDKVMVIDDGRCVYFGPAKEARAYFEGLGFLEKPRQTTPDYLTGCK
jgi:ABC-type multidrug transport system ATPase subunit